MQGRLLAIAGTAAMAVLAGTIRVEGETADWCAWRGPSHNGVTSDTDWSPTALSGEPKIVWLVDVGGGYSGVSVCGERVFTMGNDEEIDTVYSLDASTGKTLWKHTYPCKRGSYVGPRATPVVDEGEWVYTVSREGDVFCLGVGDGKVRWRRSLTKEEHAGTPRWGIAGSARILDGMVLLNAGRRGMALDKATGKTLWTNGGGTGGYSTPVVFDHGGKPAAAMFGEKHVYAVDAATGRQLFEFGWETKYDVNAADPVIDGNRMFVSSGYGKGCALLDISGQTPRVVWENKQMKNHFSSSILYGGYLYGVDGSPGKGALRCMDFGTGHEAWHADLGFGSLIIAGGKILHLNEGGTLTVAEARPQAYQQLAQARVLKKKVCWTAPVLCRGRVYCRNSSGQLVSIDVRP